MANEPSKTPAQAQPQSIPLTKIHDLPGVFNPKPQDKSLGSMVLSIQSSGVKEPVILRQRDDGEYQLLSGEQVRDGPQRLQRPLPGLGEVPLVGAEKQFILFIQHHHLDRGGADVYSE